MTFAGVATLAAVGRRLGRPTQSIRPGAALALLAAFAATLAFPAPCRRACAALRRSGQPLIEAGPPAEAARRHLHVALLGVATGLLWAPCAGPILGLVLTGAALSGPTARTTLLLFAYAAGAATSLAIAILAGGTLFAALKRSLGAGEWIRRGLGVAVLPRSPASRFGWDSAACSRGSPRAAPTAASNRSAPAPTSGDCARAHRGHGELRSDDDFTRRAAGLADRGAHPSLAGATGWLNSPPLTRNRSGVKWCWSISGPIRASTVCARCPT